jgi:hypothetical protein
MEITATVKRVGAVSIAFAITLLALTWIQALTLRVCPSATNGNTVFSIDGVRPSDKLEIVTQRWGLPETSYPDALIWLEPSFRRIALNGDQVREVVGKELTFGTKRFFAGAAPETISWNLRGFKVRSDYLTFKDSTGNVLILTQKEVNKPKFASAPVSGFILRRP